MKKVELLAPAGSMESLKSAILAGCDAVYLGGYSFGARSFASNFSNEEMIEAVKYAHLRNVKVYVTMNTLIYENETESFFSYLDFLYQANVDAVLVQDLGMMDVIRKVYPDLELHASTQMHIHNLEGVKFAKKMGIKRVVLARETPIEEIEKIKKEVDLDLEIFVHGALCVSYSGQCFMSSLIGGRSGNRGTCAQSCRQKYQLFQEENGKKIPITSESYLLSTRDLNTLEYLGDLIDAGVNSLKIEGRMKRPEYVYYVVSLYRKAIDSYYENGKIIITEQEQINLKKLFHRTFTKGFLFHETSDHFIHSFRPNHLGVEVGKVIDVKKNQVSVLLTDSVSIHDGLRIFGEKEDVGCTLNEFYKNHKLVKEADAFDTITFDVKGFVKKGSKVVKTTDFKQLTSIEEELKGERKVFILGHCEIQENSPIKLTLSCGDIQVSVLGNQKIEKALSIPTPKERVKEQFQKLGNTIYTFSKFTIFMAEDLFVPMKECNEVRRKAIDLLSEKRLVSHPKKKGNYVISVPDFPSKRGKTLYAKKEASICFSSYDEVYLEEPLYSKYSNSNVVLKLPRVIKKYPDVSSKVLIGEVGGLLLYKDFETDFSIHVTNSYTLAFLHSLGAKKVTLSYELNDSQIEELLKEYEKRYQRHPNVELIVDGYLEAMIMKYNFFDDYHVKGKTLYLKDRYSNDYLVEDKDDYVILYHPLKREYKNIEKYYEMGVSYLRTEK